MRNTQDEQVWRGFNSLTTENYKSKNTFINVQA